MDVIFIDIASLTSPDELQRIFVQRNSTLKALVSQASVALEFEVYRLYLDNKRLTDIDQLRNYDIIYATAVCSPEQSFREYNKLDSDVMCDNDTFFTEDQNNIRAVVLGEPGAGKSAFVFRFVYNTFSHKHIHNFIAVEYSHMLEVGGYDYNVSILDATDSYVEENRENWLKNRSLYMIAISVDQLSEWKSTLSKYTALLKDMSPMLVVIVITKIDIIDQMSRDQKREAFTQIKKIEVFAEENNLTVFKTSAKTNTKINCPFILATKRLVSFRLRISAMSEGCEVTSHKKPFLFELLDRAISKCLGRLHHLQC